MKASIEILRPYSKNLIKDVYDDIEGISSAILKLCPKFEYPDWSNKTVGEFLTKYGKECTLEGHAIKKTEGGQGGKKGHSQMSHWTGTEIIKKEAKKARRQLDKKEERVAKFESFLDNLKGHGQDMLIETVRKGFEVYIEANINWPDIISPEEETEHVDFPKEFVSDGVKKDIEIQISPDGKYARYRKANKISNWREVYTENMENPDAGPGIFDDDDKYLEFVEFNII